jgi:hypothetical protein
MALLSHHCSARIIFKVWFLKPRSGHCNAAKNFMKTFAIVFLGLVSFLANASAEPVELPLRQTLVQGHPIYSVPVRVGSTLIETGVDTGSTGLRVLPNVLRPQDAQAGEQPDSYAYGSGIRIDGVVGTAQIAFGNRAGQGLIQMIRTVGCVARQPNCPATHVGGIEHYGITGQGIPDAGFKAIAGFASRHRSPASRHSPWCSLA